MKKDVGDKIPAAVKRQARKIAKYNLLPVGKNAVYDLFSMLLVVVEAAATKHSLELTAKGLDADTVFHHLQKLSVGSTEGMLKHFVQRAVRLLKRLFGNRKFAVAIDFTEEMYYGEKGNPCVVGTKHKAGSNFAYRYLTVNIVVKDCRFFIFSYPVFERGNNKFYVEKVLNVLEEFGIKTYVLLLDREFNEAGTINLLRERGYHYIIPSDQDSKFRRWAKAAGRYPAIARGWKIGEAETTLVILKEKGHIYGYLTNLPEKQYEDDAHHLSFLYSKRWGIETAHRVDDKFRVYTTSKNGIVRYFFFVVSLLLYNLWVGINLAFGLGGGRTIKVDEIKDLLRTISDEFWHWLSSPERWFSFGLGNEKQGRGFLPKMGLFCLQPR